MSHIPTCANGPCFPGVLCFDRKPPYVGYVCGRCPAGFLGNGRMCTKVPRPGTFHLFRNLKGFLHRKAVRRCELGWRYNPLYSVTEPWRLCSVTLTWGAAGRNYFRNAWLHELKSDRLTTSFAARENSSWQALFNGMNHHICISATALAQDFRACFLLSKIRTWHMPVSLSPPSFLILLLQGICSTRWPVEKIIKCHARTTIPTTEGSR